MANRRLTTEEVVSRVKEMYGDSVITDKINYTKNTEKITLVCPIHGEYQKRANEVLKGKGNCPKCARNSLSLIQFKERANILFNSFYDYTKVNFRSTHDKIIITCPIHGDFTKEVREHLSGQGCPKCKGWHKTVEDIITEFKEVQGDNKYDYSLIKTYKNNNEKLPIICHEKDEYGNEHGIFYQSYTTHKKGHGCHKCSNMLIYNTDYFFNKIKELYSDENGNLIYDYSLVKEVRRSTDKLKIICPKHGEFVKTASEHLNGQGCPMCKGKHKTTEIFVYELKEIFGESLIYDKVNYVNAREKVCLICPKHGEFFAMPNNLLYGKGCPICHESKLERKIAAILTKNNIEFERQKTFDWLVYVDKQKLDFYIESLNLAIECQGIQHIIKENRLFNKDLITIKRDFNKFKLCVENKVNILYVFDDNINLDVIFSDEELSQIYNSKNSIHLNQLVDYLKQ